MDTVDVQVGSGNRAQRAMGTVEKRGVRWYGRVSLPNGKRPWVPLGPAVGPERMTKIRAHDKLAGLIERGLAAGKLEEYVERARLAMGVRARALGGADAATKPTTTVRQLGTAWTSGKLLEEHGPVRKLRPLASARINALTLARHVYDVRTRGPAAPAFGDMFVADVTTEDVAKVMAAQPKDHAAQTLIHTYQRMRRIFDLAEFPCRLRLDGTNPVKDYLRPTRDPGKLFSFLYPEDVLALLRSGAIPLGRRMLYAIATYTGLRKESLYALRWGQIDLDNGTMTVLHQKGRRRLDGAAGGRALFFDIAPALLPALRAYHKLRNAGDDEPVIVGIGCEAYHDEAKVLREDLSLVGVTRAALVDQCSPNVEPLRFHDLRGTFCTWARRAGWPDEKISRSTGHLSREMIDRYTHAASTLADLRMTPFPSLDGVIPELPTSLPTANRDEDLDTENGGPAVPVEPETTSSGTGSQVEVLAGNTVGVRVPSFAPDGFHKGEATRANALAGWRSR